MWGDSGDIAYDTTHGAPGGAGSIKANIWTVEKASEKSPSYQFAGVNTGWNGNQYAITGDGICFWSFAERATRVDLVFDHTEEGTEVKCPQVIIPEGKGYTTIPWSEIDLGSKKALSKLDFRVHVDGGAGVANTVYIDDIGVYSEAANKQIDANDDYELQGGGIDVRDLVFLAVKEDQLPPTYDKSVDVKRLRGIILAK